MYEILLIQIPFVELFGRRETKRKIKFALTLSRAFPKIKVLRVVKTIEIKVDVKRGRKKSVRTILKK